MNCAGGGAGGWTADGTASGSRGRRLFSILLENARISLLEDSAQDGSVGSPLESVFISYDKIRLRDDPSGTVSCFDFQLNRQC